MKFLKIFSKQVELELEKTSIALVLETDCLDLVGTLLCSNHVAVFFPFNPPIILTLDTVVAIAKWTIRCMHFFYMHVCMNREKISV